MVGALRPRSRRGQCWQDLRELRPSQRTPPGSRLGAEPGFRAPHPDRTLSGRSQPRQRRRAPRGGLATAAHPRSHYDLTSLDAGNRTPMQGATGATWPVRLALRSPEEAATLVRVGHPYANANSQVAAPLLRQVQREPTGVVKGCRQPRSSWHGRATASPAQARSTRSACGPRSLCRTWKRTLSPSYSSWPSRTTETCTKRSGPPESGVMKPNPRSAS